MPIRRSLDLLLVPGERFPSAPPRNSKCIASSGRKPRWTREATLARRAKMLATSCAGSQRLAGMPPYREAYSGFNRTYRDNEPFQGSGDGLATEALDVASVWSLRRQRL
jgi:hypothetical protein